MTGYQYLDMYGGHAVISIGHTHPHYVYRLTHQFNQLAFYSNSIRIPIQQELAAKLGKVSGKKDYRYSFVTPVPRRMRMPSNLPPSIPEEKK